MGPPDFRRSLCDCRHAAHTRFGVDASRRSRLRPGCRNSDGWLSATTAAAMSFLIARYVARVKVEEIASRNPKFSAIDSAIGEGGWKIVALLRLSPAVPFNLQNYCMASRRFVFGPVSGLARSSCCRERSCTFTSGIWAARGLRRPPAVEPAAGAPGNGRCWWWACWLRLRSPFTSRASPTTRSKTRRQSPLRNPGSSSL